MPLLVALCGGKTSDLRGHLALCKVALSEDGKAPEWIQLVPAGKVRALDGRKFQNTKPQAVIDDFNSTDVDLVIDWNHASEIKAGEGEQSPAAGWINALEIRDGAIWGHVDWTDAGAESIVSKAYRYISPAFSHNSKTGEVARIYSVGLVNQPALDMPALAAIDPTNQENTTMDPKLLAALGLSADATIEQMVAAIEASKVKAAATETSVTQATEALATAETALASERKSHGETKIVLGAAPKLEDFVPRGDYDTALASNKKLVEEKEAGIATALTEKIDVVIASALKAGKITPATSDYHKTLCATDGGLEAFAKFVDAAPVVGDVSDLDTRDISENKDGKTMTATETKVSALCGVESDTFIATRNAS